jgi:hypothetical protein
MPTSVMRWAKQQLERPVLEVREWSQRTSEARFVVDKSARNDGQTHCCKFGRRSSLAFKPCVRSASADLS